MKNSPKTGPEQIEHESSGSHSLKIKQLEGDVIVGAKILVYVIFSKLSSKIILVVDITEVWFFLDKTAVKIRRR
jgi:hypothetical protein